MTHCFSMILVLLLAFFHSRVTSSTTLNEVFLSTTFEMPMKSLKLGLLFKCSAPKDNLAIYLKCLITYFPVLKSFFRSQLWWKEIIFGDWVKINLTKWIQIDIPALMSLSQMFRLFAIQSVVKLKRRSMAFCWAEYSYLYWKIWFWWWSHWQNHHFSTLILYCIVLVGWDQHISHPRVNASY